MTEVKLPDELAAAARSLEERFKFLRVPTRKVPLTEWNTLSSDVLKFIPDWIPTLLANHSLVGGVLECGNNNYNQHWLRWFGFPDPAWYQQVLTSGDYCLQLDILDAGLVPISDEQNGDFWTISVSGGPSSPVYFYSLSGAENIFASSRLALLMSSMAVSEMSYPENGKTSVMWHREI
ncbi:MAG TPA: hypothetical protein VG938_06320 [Verrucomicrobiae bacterium]|jgi:hypothetical protein|nr:hypothetical protein [Verrucomicrobiae bacterium]